MAIVLSELKTELQTDPRAYGYAPHIASGNMQTLANMLNQVRPTISIIQGLILREQVLACWVLAEMEAIQTTNPAMLEWLCRETEEDFQMTLEINSGGGFSVKPYESLYTNILGTLGTGDAFTTETAMGNLQTREGSRGEELWEAGTKVGWSDCAQALAL